MSETLRYCAGKHLLLIRYTVSLCRDVSHITNHSAQLSKPGRSAASEPRIPFGIRRRNGVQRAFVGAAASQGAGARLDEYESVLSYIACRPANSQFKLTLKTLLQCSICERLDGIPLAIELRHPRQIVHAAADCRTTRRSLEAAHGLERRVAAPANLRAVID